MKRNTTPLSENVIVDTDTAADDAIALLLAAIADDVELTGVTIVAGNARFEREVENAKYTLEVAGKAGDVPVYEGARSPLEKEYEIAEHVHGEGGLGGQLVPETGIASADGHAADFIAEAARDEEGEQSLLCLGPLTNVALALDREPDLPRLVDEVVVMGGTYRAGGSITPAAEYNFWVDPDASRRVIRNFDTTLVCWDTCEDNPVSPEGLARIESASDESPYADFFTTVTARLRSVLGEVYPADGLILADPLATAVFLDDELPTREWTCAVDVDVRSGMTRGYTSVDRLGISDDDDTTTVVTDVDTDRFERLVVDGMVRGAL